MKNLYGKKEGQVNASIDEIGSNIDLVHMH